MGVAWSQMWPPAAKFTEDNLPDLTGRVMLITGATSGVGYELANMLFNAGATVWIGGRSAADAQRVMDELSSSALDQGALPNGKLRFLEIDLSDLSTIKPATNKFLSEESRLDVLFNNVAVSLPPLGSKSAQGHELMMATNCLGPYALTLLLQPLLQATAAKTLPNQTRVIWTTSFFAEISLPKDGMDLSLLDTPSQDQNINYANTKLGNFYMAHTFAQTEAQHTQRAVIHLAQNPGNLKTRILRHAPRLMQFCVQPLLYPAKQGAYTELWSGLGPEITEEDNGRWVIPWGRLHLGLSDELLGNMRTSDGEPGKAQRFRAWRDERVEAFL